MVERMKLAETPQQAVAYLYPETINGANDVRAASNTTFVLQYWPESLSDTHPVSYSPKEIPGGSHPLYQWTGGGERTISFEAAFTSELADPEIARKNPGIPSSRYTVDIKSAIARLEAMKLPTYPKSGRNSRVIPPSRLVLVFPKTNLGRGSDHLLVILKDVSWTYESWFPDGTPRVVNASLSFSESVQKAVTKGSSIKFIGRNAYSRELLNGYTFNKGSGSS